MVAILQFSLVEEEAVAEEERVGWRGWVLSRLPFSICFNTFLHGCCSLCFFVGLSFSSILASRLKPSFFLSLSSSPLDCFFLLLVDSVNLPSLSFLHTAHSQRSISVSWELLINLLWNYRKLCAGRNFASISLSGFNSQGEKWKEVKRKEKEREKMRKEKFQRSNFRNLEGLVIGWPGSAPFQKLHWEICWVSVLKIHKKKLWFLTLVESFFLLCSLALNLSSFMQFIFLLSWE